MSCTHHENCNVQNLYIPFSAVRANNAQTEKAAMEEIINLDSEEARATLTRMVVKLFDHWKLSSDDRLKVLGLDPGHILAADTPLPAGDVYIRIGLLISIHKVLGLLFPYDNNQKYSWIKAQRAFKGIRPLDVIIDDGIPGIQRILNYLNSI
jgi:hypothetical protein